MDENELRKLVEVAILELFFQWRIAGVKQVTLGPDGFRPVTPENPAPSGAAVHSVACDVGPIVQDMLRRARGSVDDTTRLLVVAALSGKGGRA